METYFAQLMPEGRDLERPAAWHGTWPREVPSVDELAARMGVDFSDEQVSQLEEDRRIDSEEVDLQPPWRPGDPEPRETWTRRAVREGQERALIQECERPRQRQAEIPRFP
jgi:hypothetical protein